MSPTSFNNSNSSNYSESNSTADKRYDLSTAARNIRKRLGEAGLILGQSANDLGVPPQMQKGDGACSSETVASILADCESMACGLVQVAKEIRDQVGDPNPNAKTLDAAVGYEPKAHFVGGSSSR